MAELMKANLSLSPALWGAALMLTSLALFQSSAASARELPSDAEMITHFKAHREELQKRPVAECVDRRVEPQWFLVLCTSRVS